MKNEHKPMCFRHKYITPNLDKYSVCLNCPYQAECTTRSQYTHDANQATQDIVSLHPQRCETCNRRGCYFHPNMGTKERGLDIDHPITIPVFIDRFGCASYSTAQSGRDKVLDEVISLVNKNCFELEGKQLKITPLLLLQEIDKLRQSKQAGEQT